MKIALSTDHAGFEALKLIETFVTELGHTCMNFGPTSFDADDDYPDFMFPAAQAVANGECDRGIILGGSGQGEAMTANRIPGVRAAVFYGPVTAKAAVDASGNQSTDPFEIIKLSREHNNTNVLSLGSRFLTEDEIKTAIELWLKTEFPGDERHARRIAKIDNGYAA